MAAITLTLIAVVIRVVSNPLGNVFQKRLTQGGQPPLVVNAITYLLLSAVSFFASFSVAWQQLPSSFWLYALAGGLAGAIGNGFLVKALQAGDLSVLGPINAYKAVIGMLAGVLLLGELPNVWGLLGIVLIIYGSYFVLDTTEDKFSWKLLRRKEIQFRIWAMVLTAIEAAIVKKVILLSSTTIAFAVWCWFGALFALVLLLLTRQPLRLRAAFAQGRVPLYLYLVLCIGLMQLTTNYVFEAMPVGYALSLFQLSTIVAVLLGHRVFGETDIRKKLIGSVIMLVGSVVIILLKNK